MSSSKAKIQFLFTVFVCLLVGFFVENSVAFNPRILTKPTIATSVGLEQNNNNIIRTTSSSLSGGYTKQFSAGGRTAGTTSSSGGGHRGRGPGIPISRKEKKKSQQLHSEFVGRLSSTAQRIIPSIDTTKGPAAKFIGNVCNVLNIDVDKVANLGVSFALSYSVISNINGSISLSLAWYLSSKQVRKNRSKLIFVLFDLN